MIRPQEIEEKSTQLRVPISAIERDYVQNWILKHLRAIDMVLKGGTGIRKVYFKNYRFSDDLDFTLLNEVDIDELNEQIANAAEKTQEESGINIINNGIKSNDNGYEATLSFQIKQRGVDRTKIKVDITKKSNEHVILPPGFKKIIHPYSDQLDYELKVYTLEEIMAEKIRSLFQRTRPRDLYDIWKLWNEVNWSIIDGIIQEKFLFKKIHYDLNYLRSNEEDFENAWKSSLGNQLNPLPAFSNVFNDVLQKLSDKDWFNQHY
jgi:predicted nucleotidyltransferase component of viral defense system